MVCGLPAADSVLVEKVATPPLPTVPWPIEVVPSLNVTAPVASVPLLVTVAVKVTLVPNAVVAAALLVRLVLVLCSDDATTGVIVIV